jgi:hypothetical protein
MLKRFLLFVALLFGASPAFAQFTTVTATVTDSNGIPYAGGTMSAVLVPGASGGYTLSGQPYSGRVGPVTLDGNGKFTANFGDVTLITPGSPQWQITIDSNQGGIEPPLGTGPQTFTFTSTGTTISGSSVVNISASLNALAPKLTNITVGAGSVTSVAATAPIVGTPNPIVGAGTISCPTCAATGQTNVFGAFLQDFSAATMEIPESAGFTTNVDSTIGLDTTNNNVHLWVNSADSLAAAEASAIAANTIPKATDSTHSLLTASLATDNGTTFTYTGTGGISAPVVSTGSLGSYVVVDGSKYARTAAGVQAAFTALGSNPGTVLLTPGTYAFGATTVTVSHQAQNLICLGVVYTCEIDYVGPGSGTGIALLYSGSGSELFFAEIGGLYFNGTGDTTHTKIAIELVDASQFKIHDINVQHWTGNSGSGSTPSIGIELQGREISSIERVQLSADRPINIDTNPDSTITLDVWHFADMNLIPSISTESCIVVTPGARITHWSVDGANTCAKGVSALLWNDTTAAGLSKSISIRNYHQEQSQGGTSAYAFNLTRSNAGAQQIQDIIFDNDESDGPNDSGFFLQRTTNAMIRSSLASSTSGVTSLNADNTNINTQAIGNYFNTGGTYTNSSIQSGVANNYFGTIIMPDSQGIQWLGDNFLWYNSGGTQFLRDQTNSYMAASFAPNHTSITFDATTPFSSGTHTAPSFTSNVATGTAPLTVTSTTPVAN